MTDQPDLKIVYRDPRKLVAYGRNARTHPPEQVRAIRDTIDKTRFGNPILLKDDGKTIGAGHGRQLAALLDPPLKRVPTIILTGLTDAQWKAYVIADNKLAEGSGWDLDILRLELNDLGGAGFDLGLTGFGNLELADLGVAGFEKDPEPAKIPTVKLSDRFGIVPFSVLSAREGWWQARKQAWLGLGIRSEVGRGDNLLKMSDTMLEPDPVKRLAAKRETASLKGGLTHNITPGAYDGREERKAAKGKARTFGQDLMRGEHVVGQGKGASGQASDAGLTFGAMAGQEGHPRGDPPSMGTSIFDPVLCELAYRWWSPPGGLIIDPFAGGSVRGVVAGRVGRRYMGVDLRQEQVEANQAQGREILRKKDPAVEWICGDSTDIVDLTAGAKADFVFSCPPYADLEVYSDDPKDLSTMAYQDFLAAYEKIIDQACSLLKPDRFACFVVGEVRGKDGNYIGFVPDTIRAFEKAGLRLYNEAILVTAAGSLAMRTGKQFEATRKLGKSHQNILVFLKGDAKRATSAIGQVEFGAMEDETPPDERRADHPDADYGEAL